MMKCNELQQRLDDYLDGDLDAILVSMLEQHINACGSCNSKVQQAKLLQAELKQLVLNSGSNSEKLLDDAFVSSAFEKVRALYPEKNTATNNKWFKLNAKTGFATAIAAGFSFWVVLTTFIMPVLNTSTIKQSTVNIASNISTLNLNVDEIRIVKLAINTPDGFDKVTVSVVLPPNVELKGHKNKHKLTWDTKLAKGNNILRIPLKAVNYGQGEFIAQLTHNGKVKIFKLFLKSIKPDLSNIHNTELQV